MLKNYLSRLLVAFVFATGIVQLSHASLSGYTYYYDAPAISGDGPEAIIWDPLVHSLTIASGQVDLLSSAWMYADGWSPRPQSRAQVTVTINGVSYVSSLHSIPGARTIEPNLNFNGLIPEGVFNFGENDVVWSLTYVGYLPPGAIRYTYLVKAKVFRV